MGEHKALGVGGLRKLFRFGLFLFGLLRLGGGLDGFFSRGGSSVLFNLLRRFLNGGGLFGSGLGGGLFLSRRFLFLGAGLFRF